MSGYLLDACALIALFNDENGAEKVESLLNSADHHELDTLVAAGLIEVEWIR